MSTPHETPASDQQDLASTGEARKPPKLTIPRPNTGTTPPVTKPTSGSKIPKANASATPPAEIKRAAAKKDSGKRATYDVQLDRHEAKYIVPISILPEVREFIRPFCEADPNGVGYPPNYTVTTLQLDAPNLALHHAKFHESLNRFKLRVRTYGVPGESKVFLEVKRKMGGTIVKSRTSIPFDAWDRELLYSKHVKLDFRNPKEVEGFLTFARLTREIGAEPTIWIQYVRESYFSRMDSYARVSFDTRLKYQPATEWTSWGRDRRWITLDSTLDQDKLLPFSGVILELKTLSDTPRWMIDLVMHFDLVRCGNCKYSSGIWAESIFRGTPELPLYAIELLEF